MEKYKTILLSITPLVIVSLIALIIFLTTSSFVKIRTISKNLKVIDANSDHNQALDVLEYAQKQGLEFPETIINFDTHSDLCVYAKMHKRGAEIANWINEYFAMHENTKELYWVLPTEEAVSERMKEIFIETDDQPTALYGNSAKNPAKVNPNINETPYVQYFMVDRKSGYLKEIAEGESYLAFNPIEPQDADFKKFKVIYCTEKTLPDFKNKNVFLSIDFDYISNSGYDSTGEFVNNKNPKEINLAISKMLSTIKKKNIRPQIISLTLSPIYVPQEDAPQILSFMQKFVKYSGKKDALQEYTRQLDADRRGENEPKYKNF